MSTKQFDEANWLIRGYELKKSGALRDFVKEFIGPLFSELEEHPGVSTYHFNQNQNKVNIRVYPCSEDISELIEELENDHGVASESGTWPNRNVDKEQVGGENIHIIDKKREFGSKIAVEVAKSGLSDEHRQGLLERGIHLFGNNLGIHLNANISMGQTEDNG